MKSNNSIGKIILTIFCIYFIIAFIIPFSPIIIPFIKSIGTTFWIILAVIILTLYLIFSYNKFVELSKRVSQSAGGIEVYLKQRFDLIPNLVETVKGYSKYEENILEKITELRQEYINNDAGNMAVNANLNNRYSQLIAVVENYPELKASEAFLNLQKQLSKIESQIQAARRIYNADVTVYNTKVQSFPSNLIAKLFRFKEKDLFEIDPKERKNVNINI